jgi:hypothetical protein
MIINNIDIHIQNYIIISFKIGTIAILCQILGKSALDFISFNFSKKTPYYNNFVSQIVGATILVVSGAIYFTTGKTVMLAFLIFPIYTLFTKNYELIYFKRSKFKNYFQINSILLNLLILITLVVGVKLYFYGIYGNYLVIPHTDYGTYAKITNYLEHYGIENNYLEYIYPDKFGVRPYHYYEIWLNLVFSKFFNTSHFYNYTMITSSYGLWVLCIGLIAIIEIFNKKIESKHVLLAFISTFCIGFSTSFYQKFKFLQVVEVFTTNAWSYQKLFPIYWFIIAAFLSWNYKNKIHSLIFLLCLPIVFISTAPSILLTLIIYSLYIKIKKIENFEKIIKINYLTLFVFGYIAVFYYFSKTEAGGFDLQSSLLKLGNLNHIKTSVNIIVGTSLQIIILLLPYIFILIINFNQKIIRTENLSKIIIPITIYLMGLFSWAALNNTTHAVQLFSNISIPLINIGIYYLILYIFINSEKNLKYIINLIVLSFLLIFNIYQTGNKIINEQEIINKEYIDKIEISKVKNKIGVYFNTNTYSPLHKPQVSYQLLYEHNGLDVISVGHLSTELNLNNRYYEYDKNALESSTFFNYVKKQKNNNRYKSIEESQVDFINENKIEFGIIDKESEVGNLIKSKIVKEIKDNITGDTFVIFN